MDTFLYKASKKSPTNQNPIIGTKIILKWKDGSLDHLTIPYPVKNAAQEEKVKYLPQKFVEHLCAPENNQELEEEIERVIFQRNKKTDRLNASNFQELRKRSVTQPIEAKRQRLILAIKSLNKSIADTGIRIEQERLKTTQRGRRQNELLTLVRLLRCRRKIKAKSNNWN